MTTENEHCIVTDGEERPKSEREMTREEVIRWWNTVMADRPRDPNERPIIIMSRCNADPPAAPRPEGGSL